MLLTCSVHAQNVLLNGSFESPSIPSNSVLDTDPVSWSGTNFVIINGDHSPSYPLPQDGQQYVQLGHSSILSQAFSIGINGVYMLAWFDSTEFNGPDSQSPYSVSVIDGGGNPVVSEDFDANSISLRSWSPHSLQVALVQGDYTIQFEGHVGQSGEGSHIDNVSLQIDNSDLIAKIQTSAVDVCWPGRTDQMYQVQFRNSLTDTNWFDLGSPVQGTGTNCVTDPINGRKQRFYRIGRLP